MPSSTDLSNQPEAGVTTQLCDWAAKLELEAVPIDVIERAKYILLDGIACALVGAHVPWSEKYAEVTMKFEPEGYCTVIGYEKKLGPVAASMMNAAFIQATELDDYHSEAPLHAASIAVACLLAVADFRNHASDSNGENRENKAAVSGIQALLAAIVCFESGPRIGKAVHGADLLVNGWHCGAVYGAPAGALAAGKALGLSTQMMEDAIGIGCTQACGLMSAQYGGMIKRVQHGFAARNGLLGALLAYGGYEGIKQVLERPYGGFLTMFTKGNNQKDQYIEHEVTAKLGSFWHTFALRIKMYACCGLTHGAIEAIENLQALHPAAFELSNLRNIKRIHLQMSHSAYAHCGWHPDRPVAPTGAQMSAPFILATQFIHKKCFLAQFSDANGNLDRDDVWFLVDRTTCSHNPEFDQLNQTSGGHVLVEFEDGTSLSQQVSMPRGVKEPIANEKILQKYRTLVGSIMEAKKVKAIEDIILSLEAMEDISPLMSVLGETVGSVF